VAYLYLVRSMRVLPMLFAAALLQACALREERAYQIAPAKPGDAAKVQHILRDIARQAGLPDTPQGGGLPEVLAFHQGTNVLLRAYVSPEKIEVFLSRSDWPPPQGFKKADALVAPALLETFRQRFSVLKELSIHQVIVN
jgi:hypothetical protein